MSLLKHQEKKKQSSAVQCNANHQPYTLLLLLPHPFSTFNTRHDAVCLPERNHIRSFARSNAMPTHWKRDAKVYSHTHRERERERERERDFGEKERVGVSFFWSFWSLYFPTLNLMMRLLSGTIPYKYPYISHYSCIARLQLKTRPDKEIWNECTRI